MSEEKIGMYTAEEIYEELANGFLHHSMVDAMYFKIKDLQQKVEELENIRKIAIAFVKNNKDKTIAPYGDNEDTDYEVCLFEDDINDLLNILTKEVMKNDN